MDKTRAPTKAEMAREYKSFVSTWAAHCGAPKDVFVGHLTVLLQVAAAYKADRVAAGVEAWGVGDLGSWQGMERSSMADDVAAMIRRDLLWPTTHE